MLDRADALDRRGHLLDRDRPCLLDRHVRPIVGEHEPDVDHRAAGREWALHRHDVAVDGRRRRRSFHRRGAARAGRQLDDERPADVDAVPRVVDDVEHVEDLEQIVAEFHEDTARAAEHHRALHGRRRRLRLFLLLPPLGRLLEPGDQDDAQAAGPGHGEGIGDERFAVDGHLGTAFHAGHQVRKLGATLLVGRIRRGSRSPSSRGRSARRGCCRSSRARRER